MILDTLPFGSARHLKTEEDIALYLQAVLEENDPPSSVTPWAKSPEPKV